jgi:hypothetical protein
MSSFHAFRKLIATPEPPRLGPQGRAGTMEIPALERALGEFFAEAGIPSGLQPLLRSAALLWHDHLDASHTISQGIGSRDGSWLHGIMHRREPDYGNAKYWFHRVGRHTAFGEMGERAAEFLHGHGAMGARLVPDGTWDAFAFVDECGRVEVGGSVEEQRLLRELQGIEFDMLVGHIIGR